MEKDADKQKSNSKKKVVGRPFKPGQSGNPNGRPRKDVCIPDILRKQLAQDAGEERGTKLEAICEVAILQAMKGDKDARNWIADRTEGKALERVIKHKTDDILEVV